MQELIVYQLNLLFLRANLRIFVEVPFQNVVELLNLLPFELCFIVSHNWKVYLLQLGN